MKILPPSLPPSLPTVIFFFLPLLSRFQGEVRKEGREGEGGGFVSSSWKT
jgi:hypothetical protein